MKVSLKSVLAAASITVGSMALSASAAVVNLASTVDQSGFSGLQDAASYGPLTATPYDFTGQTNFAQLTSIDSITVTLTMFDGDSAVGDFDFGSLTLGLDGVNTGLLLNGFGNNQIQTLTLNTLSPALQALLLSNLADGKYVGSVLDATPGNSTPTGDLISFPARVQTTLEITATSSATNGGGGNPVPLPAAVLLAPLGAGLAGMYSRRFRRAK